MKWNAYWNPNFTLLGTLSNNDDDGSENITKKMNLRPFKLYRVYLKPHNSSDVGEFSWSWIFKDFIHVQIEEGQFVVVCPRPPQNVASGGFRRRTRGVDVKEMY